jgi:hypothetical protein
MILRRPHQLLTVTLGVVLAVGCGRSTVSPSPSPTPSATGIVQGVVSIFGSPLEGVLVEALDGAAAGHSTTTNAAGKYRLELPVGSTRLRFSKSGYTTAESAVTIGSEPLTFDKSFNTGFWRIRGVVSGNDGAPLAGVGLYVVLSMVGKGGIIGLGVRPAAKSIRQSIGAF